MRKRTETKVVVEYPDTYPKTPECERYLTLRAKYEDAEGKRAAWNLLAVVGAASSSINNGVDNEDFRKTQYAYHDCQMTAMAFFSAKKGLTSPVVAEEEHSYEFKK